MISRRQLLFTTATVVLLPGEVTAGIGVQKKLSWPEFQEKMTELANAETPGMVDHKVVAENAMKTLQQLDISSIKFRQAVEDSYETGNRYWLWQRLIKQRNLNGGILTIDDNQLVPLHDHPGATGIVRIISGEAEICLFDETRENNVKQNKSEQGIAELVQVSRRVLRSGDTAVLTPHMGNIHALKSLSKQCRMLDFFIPPYEISQRSWFEPLTENWFDKKMILCRKIPQHAYTKA